MFNFIHNNTSLTRQRRKSLPASRCDAGHTGPRRYPSLALRAGVRRRSAFTLIELMIVIAIIGILSTLGFAAINAAYQQSRVQRTQAIIAKIDSIIMEKYESYRTRPVPIRVPPQSRILGEPWAETVADADLTNGIYDNSESFTDQNGNGVYDTGAADRRMVAMRELQRCELPNLRADVLVNPVTIVRPALSKTYLRRAVVTWTEQFEGAECLYLILAASRDGDKSSLDFFSPTEIGDFDADGMNEILDSFGQPIEFVRWPFGYSESPGLDGQWGVAGNDDDADGITDNPSEAGYGDDMKQVVTQQTRNANASPNYFDPQGADGRIRSANPFVLPVALKPLIYSAGKDKDYDIQKLSLPNPTASQLADPYRVEFATGRLSAGSPYDAAGDNGFMDNITNHDIEAR